MFAICEVREFAGSFSRPQRIGAGRIRRKLVFVVALLLMIGVGGQVARAAEGDVSPTPHPSEPPHPLDDASSFRAASPLDDASSFRAAPTPQ